MNPIKKAPTRAVAVIVTSILLLVLSVLSVDKPKQNETALDNSGSVTKSAQETAHTKKELQNKKQALRTDEGKVDDLQFPLEDNFNIRESRKASPILDHDIVSSYEAFLVAFNSPESLSEDEIQAFFRQLNDSLVSSDQAKEIVAGLYRNIPVDDHVPRLLIAEALMNSNAGRDILKSEAHFQLTEGHEYGHSEAFRILANVDRTNVNYSAVEKAAYHINYDTSEATIINALGYVGDLVENSKDQISPTHLGLVERTLSDAVLRRSDNQTIQTYAAQKLYYITEPSRSAALASEFLAASRNSSLVIETLFAIEQGHVLLDQHLESNLKNVLSRSSVTAQELDVAKQLLPRLVDSQP